MFNFNNTISDKFENGGIILSISKSQIFNLKEYKNKLIHEFENKGVIFFENFTNNNNQLIKFTDQFTRKYVADAERRESRLGHKNIKNVDSGNSEIKLHSEASFTTTWPEIIWFYCNTPPKVGAQTTLCDGLRLWEKLSRDTKKFF